MKDECGICGFVGENAEKKIFKMLIQLQHRGQLSAGMTTFQPNNDYLLKTYKGLGLANVAFKAYDENKFKQIMEKMHSTRGIGHVRYATCGKDDVEYAQPFERRHGKKTKWFSICFNGNIANYKELKQGLEESGYHLIKETDTEIIEHLISKELKKNSKDLEKVFSGLAEKLDGAYCIAFINAEGTIVVLRDPNGIKPLCYAEEKERIAFASESVALANLGFKEINDLPAGHMLIIKDNKIKLVNYSSNKKKDYCFFEWVYFSHPASVLEKKLVYNVRYKLGQELAKIETQKIDSNCVVVSVPDSSKPAGDGFSDFLKIPSKEGLIRNRYVGRTFIESKSREERVKEKFSIAREVFEGKKVFLVDDSIVRGTTMKGLIDFIKTNGNPKEIHVRVSCPPIMFPCFYGIDMGSKKEFIARAEIDNKKRIEEIRKELGVNSIVYQSFEGLFNAIGFNEKELCLACLNGTYPTKKGTELSGFCGEGRACEK